MFHPPGDCPNCGTYVQPRAKSCPECGASQETGWSDETESDGLDLPQNDDFDDEDFFARELGGPEEKPHFHWAWWLVAIALLAALLWGVLGRLI